MFKLNKDILFMTGTRMLITSTDGVGKTTFSLWQMREAKKRGLIKTFVYVNLDSKSPNQEKLFKEIAEKEEWEYLTLPNTISPKERRTFLREYTKNLNNQTEYIGIIIDNWSRLVDKENNVDLAKEALEDIQPLLRHKLSTVTMIGHLGKSEDKGLRGSSDVRSVFGVELRLQRRLGKEAKVLLTIAKENGFDGEKTLAGEVYVVEKLGNPEKINNLDSVLKLVKTDSENIISKEGLKMFKDIMSQIQYAQTLYELGKRYGEGSYINHTIFMRILGRSGTQILIDDKVVTLKFDDPEYLNASEIIESIKKNSIIVKEPTFISGVSYKGSSTELENEKVIEVMSKTEYDDFMSLVQEQFKNISYKIVELPESSMLNSIIPSTAKKSKPKEDLILENLLILLKDKKLGTTEIRVLLNKNIANLPFTAIDVKKNLKKALAKGVDSDELIIEKVKQSRFYTVNPQLSVF